MNYFSERTIAELNVCTTFKDSNWSTYAISIAVWKTIESVFLGTRTGAHFYSLGSLNLTMILVKISQFPYGNPLKFGNSFGSAFKKNRVYLRSFDCCPPTLSLHRILTRLYLTFIPLLLNLPVPHCPPFLSAYNSPQHTKTKSTVIFILPT